MLTKFEVSNFKSFEGKLSFDLSKASNFEFNAECIDRGVIKKALVYGHNGVGKSNLGFAILDLVSHLTDKNSGHKHYSNYLNALSKDGRASFSYEFRFGQNTVSYEYSKSDPETILNEKISINSIVFAFIDRDISNNATINAEGAETLKTDFGQSQISIVSYIKNNAILKETEINNCFYEFIDFVNKMLFFRSLDDNSYIGIEQGSKGIAQDIIEKNHLEEFEGFLNRVGIKCQLAVYGDDKPDLYFLFGEKRIRFYEIASQGTKSLALFYFWLQRLKENDAVKFVFIDEFDAFYHHELAAEIIKELKGICAQVIMTTHNTSLISNEIMRPDCYFLMDSKKIESLVDLSQKELREAHNIEKMYRAHAFNV